MASSAQIRVAYLNSHYPCLSHTFIEREIRAVRASGVEVHPFSIRRPSPADTLGPANAQAARETFYLLNGRMSLVRSLIRALLSRPLGLARALIASQRLSPPGIKARLLHLAYALEAVRLVREMWRRGLRHVHVHMANNGAAVAMLAAALDHSIQYSLTIHGSAEFFNVEGVRLRQKAENALFVRCISEFCRAQVMAWTAPKAWERFHVVHCGVDVATFKPGVAPASGPLRILAVGRLVPIKGYPLLLEACRELSDEGIEWRLDLVGDGPMRLMLMEKAERLGISPWVTYSGGVGQEQVHQHLDATDVLVVSSFMEGVPVVLMEAMAKGLAVVSTRVGGVAELVEDGVSGLLVTAGSAQSLADALRALAKNRCLARSLGEAGRQRVVEQYSIQIAGAEMAELFRRNLGAAPAAAAPSQLEAVQRSGA